MRMNALVATAALALLAGCGAGGDKVGSFSNDITGNQIQVEAVHDPALPNIVCHLASFDRSLIDRVRQGNWFENPSNTAVSCQRVGPIDLKAIPLSAKGQEIFSERTSLFFKRIGLRRIVDLENRTVIYVSYSREVIEGSAKIALSSVPLTPEEVAAVSKAH